ncbi:hypothetical protein BT93_G0203 [Corymbia citriodora subsp. variegata]|nr:hypothetical protein BT93_G0203 [Corymbia citriodora subsp. variegata]
MADEGGGGGGGGDGGEAGSPSNKVKFLCSHGGKILPRPADGHLKYVGGETRVISFSRDTTFSDLMKKLTTQNDADVVLKYQVAPEDLDALVSVRSDEDLRHMIEEHDRHASGGGNPRLRGFLFPANPTVVENLMAAAEAQALEQRYIDAINGIVRTVPAVRIAPPPLRVTRAAFSVSSACSSPKSQSPDSGRSIDAAAYETFSFSGNIHGNQHPMSKVHSSPSLCSLGNNAPASNSVGGRQCIHQHHHYHYPNYQKQHYHPGYYHATRPPQDPHKGIIGGGGERLHPALSLGRAEIGRSYLGQGLNSHYGPQRHHVASGGGYNNYGYYDECTGYAGVRFGRADSLPASPRRAYWDGPYYKADSPVTGGCRIRIRIRIGWHD